MDDNLDIAKLARLVFTFKNLIEHFDKKDFLLIATALEMNANDLRQQAAELARQKEANP
jgi:predicted nucleic acid-binding protein